MSSIESEPRRFLEVPWISEKTSNEQLKSWSKLRWPSEGRYRVAADIVKNGKELLAVSNTNWELVLHSIRTERLGLVQLGDRAIAMNDAIIIGGLGADVNWPMHHPEIVYLSGKCLAERVSDKLESFKSTMLNAAAMYGHKTLPDADLYMKTLDFLLGVENRPKHRETINKLQAMLGNGDIEEAYKIVKSRGDLVRRRGV